MDFFADETEQTTFEIVVGMIGNAFALFFFFSPAILMFNLIKGKQEVKKIPVILFIATWFNCTLWFIYGYYLGKLPIMLCNGIGTGLSMIYISIWLFYFFEKEMVKIITIAANLAISFGIFAAFFWFAGEEHNEDVTGNVALVFNIIMYAAPGQNLVLNILTLVRCL
jgi:uncharacterized protein with PQ loop repeat